MNRDEKGRISPAQSKIARQMRGSIPLGQRTMGQAAAQHGQKPLKHAFGESHSGVAGLSRMETLREANKGKKAKSRVILRGQKSERNKAYTKVGARMHKSGLLKAPNAAQ